MKKTSIVQNYTCNGRFINERIQRNNFNVIIFVVSRVNQIIRERSDQTAVTFIYLASPPRIDSTNWKQTSQQYLELLTELTADLPPTMLVHGVNTVQSTTL